MITANKSPPQHTPGPWRVSECLLGKNALIEHGGDSENSPIIASVYTDGGALPQEANARLIAAAPELLEALDFIVADFTPENDFRVDADTIAVVRDAIAKARGAA